MTAKKDFEKLINSLVKDDVYDPDVMLFYGALKGDKRIVDKAIEDGADETITSGTVLERYKTKLFKLAPKTLIHYIAKREKERDNIKNGELQGVK